MPKQKRGRARNAPLVAPALRDNTGCDRNDHHAVISRRLNIAPTLSHNIAAALCNDISPTLSHNVAPALCNDTR